MPTAGQSEPSRSVDTSNETPGGAHAITFFKRGGGGTGTIHHAEPVHPSRAIGQQLPDPLPDQTR